MSVGGSPSPQVVLRRQFPAAARKTLHEDGRCVAARIDRGVEEHERVRFRADLRVLAWFVEAVERRSAERQMAARGTSRGDDPGRVDAELRRVSAHPPDRGLGVGHCFERARLVAAENTVVGNDSHHSACGEMLRLRHELGHGPRRPASTKEEDDGRLRCRLATLRSKHMKAKLGTRDCLVGVGRCAFKRRGLWRQGLLRGDWYRQGRGTHQRPQKPGRLSVMTRVDNGFVGVCSAHGRVAADYTRSLFHSLLRGFTGRW
jgi:hypothetical protein